MPPYRLSQPARPLTWARTARIRRPPPRSRQTEPAWTRPTLARARALRRPDIFIILSRQREHLTFFADIRVGEPQRSGRGKTMFFFRSRITCAIQQQFQVLTF